jgi:hypothetical protein
MQSVNTIHEWWGQEEGSQQTSGCQGGFLEDETWPEFGKSGY